MSSVQIEVQHLQKELNFQEFSSFFEFIIDLSAALYDKIFTYTIQISSEETDFNSAWFNPVFSD